MRSTSRSVSIARDAESLLLPTRKLERSLVEAVLHFVRQGRGLQVQTRDLPPGVTPGAGTAASPRQRASLTYTRGAPDHGSSAS